MKKISVIFKDNGNVSADIDKDITLAEILLAARLLNLKADWKISDQLMGDSK